MADYELEEDLIRRAQAGELSVAPLLVSVFGDRLLGYARSHAPDLSDSDREQIVELAVEAGVRAMGKFDPARGTPFSWFRQQIRYRTLDWRRNRPHMVEPPEDLGIPEGPPPVDESMRSNVQRALRELSKKDREILALRSVEQLAFEDIGHRLDIKPDTARQRHRRALSHLESRLLSMPEVAAKYSSGEEG
jgi:RNA polymerase sigma factor (sigma-70 family)